MSSRSSRITEPLARSAALTGYADLARSLGLDPIRLVGEQGLPAGCLTNPDLWIPAFAVGHLLESAAQASGVMDFGLRLAETRRLSNLGAIGLVLREQPTLRRALEAMISYSWAQNQALTLKLEILGDIAILREGASSVAGRQSDELALGVLALTVRRLVGPVWRPNEVWFTHSRPDDTTAHRRVFTVMPRFNEEIDALVMSASDLDSPIAGADPVAASRALRYLDLEARLGDNDPTAAVRELILALLPTGSCTIERVAAHLGMSRRTLCRRLAAASALTFTELLNEIRIGLAQRYLAAGRHSLTEIAERLGYASLSAFSRWRRFNLGVDREERAELRSLQSST